MLRNFSPSKPVEETRFELVFRLEDDQDSAFSFECDERGTFVRDKLPNLVLHNLRACLKGEVDGYPVRSGVVRSYVQSFIADGGGTCVCGAHVTLHSSWTNTCGGCGREYNGSGQLLAERDVWGEETGESVADIKLDYDPETHW